MHFGRVDHDRGLSLSLPESRRRTLGYLNLPHQGRGVIYPAPPIWAERDWVGSIYPEASRPGEFLRYFAERYRSVEYNGSFYRLPALAQVHSWVKQVGVGFRFCPKVPQGISHRLLEPRDYGLLNDFYRVLEAFGDSCGLSFLQLPEWFAPQHAPALLGFMKEWSTDWPLAIEFRHPQWFQDQMLLDPVIDALYRNRMSAVITDTPGRRDVLHMSLCHPQLIVRFLGCFPSSQDEKRLTAWAERLIEWSAAGMDSLYFFVHQARHIGIPPSVDYLQRVLFKLQSRNEARE